MDFDVRDLDGVDRTFAVRGHASDFLHQFDCRVIALAENGVPAIEAGVRHFGDKELRAVGVGSGVSVGESSGAIELDAGRSLILEFVAGIAGAVARRISTLNHELGNHTVEDSSVIEWDAVFLYGR